VHGDEIGLEGQLGRHMTYQRAGRSGKGTLCTLGFICSFLNSAGCRRTF